MLAATISVMISPLVGWGLPKNVSSYGPAVDLLFHVILFVTGFFFILTETLLVYFMYAFAGRSDPPTHPRPAEKAGPPPGTFFRKVTKPLTGVIPDEHRLEMVWTLVPGVILFILAVAQINTWLWIKDRNWMPKPDEGKEVMQMEVSARQFEWRVRYPSPERMKSWEGDVARSKDFGSAPHEDDLYIVNEVH